MSTDDWTKALREAGLELEARESETLEQVPDEWMRLAEGELTPEERRALEARRAENPDMFAAFAPLDPTFTRALAEQHLPPTRTPFTARLRRWWWSPLLVVAAGAAAVLLVPFPKEATLPSFTLEATGGDAVMRAKPNVAARSLEASAGSRIELRLIPAVPVNGPTAVAVRLYSPAGQWVSWIPKITQQPGGAVIVTARVGQEFPAEPGVYRAVVAVGSPGADPTVLDAALGSPGVSALPWHVHSTEVTVLAGR
ncbi:MAG: hypothetical protein AAFU77_04415 [Myxococcota bacterium]